jgi:hypothetical protein
MNREYKKNATKVVKDLNDKGKLKDWHLIFATPSNPIPEDYKILGETYSTTIWIL